MMQATNPIHITINFRFSEKLSFAHSDFRSPHRNIGTSGIPEFAGIPISVTDFFRFPDIVAECRKPEIPTKSSSSVRTTPLTAVPRMSTDAYRCFNTVDS